MPSKKSTGPRAGMGGNTDSAAKGAATKRNNAARVVELEAEVKDLQAKLSTEKAMTDSLRLDQQRGAGITKTRDREFKRQMEELQETHKLEVKRLKERQADKIKKLTYQINLREPVGQVSEQGDGEKVTVNYYQVKYGDKLNFNGSVEKTLMDVLELDELILQEKKILATEVPQCEEAFYLLKTNFQKANEKRDLVLKRQLDLPAFELAFVNKRTKLLNDRKSAATAGNREPMAQPINPTGQADVNMPNDTGPVTTAKSDTSRPSVDSVLIVVVDPSNGTNASQTSNVQNPRTGVPSGIIQHPITGNPVTRSFDGVVLDRSGLRSMYVGN